LTFAIYLKGRAE